MSQIPSLLEYQKVPAFRTSLLKNYSCVICGKAFEIERYLKDHINSVHVKSLKCDFCDYCVAPRRRRRLIEHQRKRHGFPVPSAGRSPLPCTDPTYFVSTTATEMQETVQETAPVLTRDNLVNNSVLIDSSECNLTHSPVFLNGPSRSSTPCQDEQPALPLFPEFDPPFAPFSPLGSSNQPTLQDLIDEPEVAQEAPVTSSPSGVTDAELQAAVDSILPDVVPSTPEPVTTLNPLEGHSLTIGSGNDVECDQYLATQTISGHINQLDAPCSAPGTYSSPAPTQSPTPVASFDSAGDILVQAADMAEVPRTPEFQVWQLPPTGPADPRYFFFGAPSMADNSPHARLIQEARERAIRGWRQNDYSVEFTPMNLFAIMKVERVRLPDGTDYSLSSYWIEMPESLQ